MSTNTGTPPTGFVYIVVKLNPVPIHPDAPGCIGLIPVFDSWEAAKSFATNRQIVAVRAYEL